MSNRLSDGEKVVVSVFVTLFAGAVAGLFFFGNAILDLKDGITDLQISMGAMRRDIADLREDVSTLQQDVATLQQDVATLQQDVATLQQDMVRFRAEVAERFDAIEARRSATGAAGVEGRSPPRS